MKQSRWKIFLIVGSVALPACSPCIPPDKKLKLGIDLSGGTILVYEVDRENLPPNFNMDELISALKQRADPEGVKENADPQDRQQPDRDHPPPGQPTRRWRRSRRC